MRGPFQNVPIIFFKTPQISKLRPPNNTYPYLSFISLLMLILNLPIPPLFYLFLQSFLFIRAMYIFLSFECTGSPVRSSIEQDKEGFVTGSKRKRIDGYPPRDGGRRSNSL